MTIDDLCHDQLTHEVYDDAELVVLLPSEIRLLDEALRRMIGIKHSDACMARLLHDNNEAQRQDRIYENYCHLYERIMGKSPFAATKEAQ